MEHRDNGYVNSPLRQAYISAPNKVSETKYKWGYRKPLGC